MILLSIIAIFVLFYILSKYVDFSLKITHANGRVVVNINTEDEGKYEEDPSFVFDLEAFEIEKVLPLVDRYIAMIETIPGIVAKQAESEDNHLHIAHILWMLDYMHDHYEDMSLTKLHRWLGFCQCIIILNNLTTVAKERNFTRSIFNGS